MLEETRHVFRVPTRLRSDSDGLIHNHLKQDKFGRGSSDPSDSGTSAAAVCNDNFDSGIQTPPMEKSQEGDKSIVPKSSLQRSYTLGQQKLGYQFAQKKGGHP